MQERRRKGSTASSPPSATEFTPSTPQSPFARAGSFPIAMPGLPAIAFMTQCLPRLLKRMVMACSRDGTRCLAHGLRSLWLLLELAEAVGLARLPLGVEGLEFLLEPLLGREARTGRCSGFEA
jgi:hypothetical protein